MPLFNSSRFILNLACQLSTSSVNIGAFAFPHGSRYVSGFQCLPEHNHGVTIRPFPW
jgi:hypothetical protein